VKQSRKAVQSFVLKPKEADLRVPGALTVEKLRVAMELDMSQFKEVTVSILAVIQRLSLTGMRGSGPTSNSSERKT